MKPSVLPIAFGDNSASQFADRKILQGEIVTLACLDDGTSGGNPSVGFFIETPEGLVYCSTTWKLFNAAHAAMRGRWGEIDEP